MSEQLSTRQDAIDPSGLPPQLEAKTPSPFKAESGCSEIHIGIRLAIAGTLLIILSGMSIVVYIFGMLMFAFSGDAATAGSYPKWIEPFMLLGWPITIAVAVLVPPIVLRSGQNCDTGFHLSCWHSCCRLSVTSVAG